MFDGGARQAIDTYGVGRVVASGRADLEKGELVVGLLTWGEYTLAEPGRLLNKLDAMGQDLPHHVGALGNFFIPNVSK